MSVKVDDLMFSPHLSPGLRSMGVMIAQHVTAAGHLISVAEALREPARLLLGGARYEVALQVDGEFRGTWRTSSDAGLQIILDTLSALPPSDHDPVIHG